MTKSDKTKYKYFNGRKYYLYQRRWRTTTRPETFLSHDIWNFNNPNDQIIKGDGNVIHHKNENKSDDRIENLEKMTHAKHASLHNAGEKNSFFGIHNIGSNHPNWKGGLKYKKLYLGGKQINGEGYKIYQHVNSLGEILSSGFIIVNSCRTKKENG